MAPVISPSHQLSVMSRQVTAVKVKTEMIRNTTPKPANRLIDPRSVVARDSSCPDCHSSWKAGSSRCRCRYMSSLIVFSMSATAFPCTQRRMRLSVADAAPRPTASSPMGSSRLRSWCAMASSMTALARSGMVISAASTATAAAIIPASWRRCGRR